MSLLSSPLVCPVEYLTYQQGRAAGSPFFFGGVMVLRRGPSGPHAVSLFYFSMVSDYKVALQCCYLQL